MWIYGFIIIIHVRGWWRFHFWKGHVSVKYPLYGLHVCKLLNVTFGVFIHNIWNGLIAVNDWGIFTFIFKHTFQIEKRPFLRYTDKLCFNNIGNVEPEKLLGWIRWKFKIAFFGGKGDVKPTVVYWE